MESNDSTSFILKQVYLAYFRENSQKSVISSDSSSVIAEILISNENKDLKREGKQVDYEFLGIRANNVS